MLGSSWLHSVEVQIRPTRMLCSTEWQQQTAQKSSPKQAADVANDVQQRGPSRRLAPHSCAAPHALEAECGALVAEFDCHGSARLRELQTNKGQPSCMGRSAPPQLGHWQAGRKAELSSARCN